MRKINTEKIKNIFRWCKDVWGDPQKKAIIMLIIMFLFFSFLVSNVRSNHKKIDSSNTIQSNDFEFSLDKIKKKNYHFKYIVNIDGLLNNYEGDCYGEKELFNKNNAEQFYKYNKIYLKNMNGVWTKDNNPYLLSEYKDIDIIEKIMKKSTFESKTENKDKITNYTYKISTTSLIKILEIKNIDIDDLPNTIVLTTDKDNNVEKIEYDLTSYSKYKNYSINNTNILIEYSKFDNIKEIEDPE